MAHGAFRQPPSYLEKALACPGEPVPPALLALEAEAEVEDLGRDIECHFSRASAFPDRAAEQREEEELGRRRVECLGRWVGLLRGLERVWRGFCDPGRDLAEVDLTTMMGALGIE